MKYKVGDKVIIKSYQELKKLSIGEDGVELYFEYDVFVINNMGKFCNKIMTIKDISIPPGNSSHGQISYILLEDECDYYWYEEWFLPVTEAGEILYGEVE